MKGNGRAVLCLAQRWAVLVAMVTVVPSLLVPDAVAQVRGQRSSVLKSDVKPVAARRVAKGKVVKASWYGGRFHGRRAANGRAFDQARLTAAHRSWRLGTKVEVRNPRNGRAVVVEITDRGPFVRGREIDLSYAAADKLGIVRAGVAPVEVRLIDESAQPSPGAPVLIASAAAELNPAWPRAITR